MFLIDRREPELVQLIAEWKRKLDRCKGSEPTAVEFTPKMPKPAHPRRRPDMTPPRFAALWLRDAPAPQFGDRPVAFAQIGARGFPHCGPEHGVVAAPVIWPDEEELWKRIINEAIRNGAKHFVCNEPWQAAFFKGREVDLVAGPFCNAANAFTLASFAKLGFSAAFVSPELTKEDFLALPKTSPLPARHRARRFLADGHRAARSSRHQAERSLSEPQGGRLLDPPLWAEHMDLSRVALGHHGASPRA